MSEINGCPNPDCNDPDCPGITGDHGGLEGLFGGARAISLGDLLSGAFGRQNKKTKTKDLGILDPDEVKAFNEMRNTFVEARETLKKAEGLKKKFWAMTRLNHNLFSEEHDNLHVDEKTGMLSCEVEDKEEKKS